jgi:hypothetical protein
MKSTALLIATASALVSVTATADEYVHGYDRSNGTYVQGYTRSSPNNIVTDNYSYHGNTNRDTGGTGTNHYRHGMTSPYDQGPLHQYRRGTDRRAILLGGHTTHGAARRAHGRQPGVE